MQCVKCTENVVKLVDRMNIKQRCKENSETGSVTSTIPLRCHMRVIALMCAVCNQVQKS